MKQRIQKWLNILNHLEGDLPQLQNYALKI
jgi:hypothetical protein